VGLGHEVNVDLDQLGIPQKNGPEHQGGELMWEAISGGGVWLRKGSKKLLE